MSVLAPPPAPVSGPPRKRLSLLAVGTGLVGSLVLVSSMSTTLSAFTASITNDTNTLGVGSLVMRQRDDAGNECRSSSSDGPTGGSNAATCSTINTFGGSVIGPGDTVDRTITIDNVGVTTAREFTLTPGECTVTGGDEGDNRLCDQLTISITEIDEQAGDKRELVDGDPLAKFAERGTIGVAKEVQRKNVYRFDVRVSLNPDYDRSDQVLTVNQPLVWTFTA